MDFSKPHPTFLLLAIAVCFQSAILVTSETSVNDRICPVQELKNVTVMKEVKQKTEMPFLRCSLAEDDPVKYQIIAQDVTPGYCRMLVTTVVEQAMQEEQLVSVNSCCDVWSGPECSSAVCTEPCLHGGVCSSPGVCGCTGTGYEGTHCETPVCSSGCLNGGQCIAPEVCGCSSGFEGPACEQFSCKDIGGCLHGICKGPNSCACTSGWTGDNCNKVDCGGDCSPGTCGEDGRCICPELYTGRLCETPICERPCLNGGQCTAPQHCNCTAGFIGANCGLSVIDDGANFVTRMSDTLYDEHSRCSLYGGGHFETFDGMTYNYQGKGTYTLFEDCQTVEPVFRVHVNLTSQCSEDEPEDCEIGLKISKAGYQIHILPGGIILVNSRQVEAPQQIGTVIISTIAEYVVISGLGELKIKFDGKKSVYVYAPESAQRQLCGMCGFFDGNKTNDWSSYAGVDLADVHTFAESWIDPEDTRAGIKIPRSARTNVHPCATLAETNPSLVESIRNECQMLSNDQLIFNECTHTVDPSPYINSCLRDMCSCSLKSTSDHMESCEHWRCEGATQLARACAHKGIVLDWRGSIGCEAPHCDNNMAFQECGRDCGRSCGSEGFENECENDCVDGCFCVDGALWDGYHCIHRDECPCTLSSEQYTYPVGSLEQHGCESCVVYDGFLHQLGWHNELNLAVVGSQIVGLVPLRALLQSADYFMEKENLFILEEDQKLTLVINRLGLNSYGTFNPKERVIEYMTQEDRDGPLVTMSVKEFIATVGSRSPSPGGGSVAALAATLGASLAAMVGFLTYGNKKFAALDSKMRQLIPPLYKAMKDLTPFVDADAAAFSEYMLALKMPRKTEAEGELRDIAMQQGLQTAVQVPLTVAKITNSLWSTLKELAVAGNINCRSDLQVGVRSLEMGVWGTYYNVITNLSDIKDEEYKAKVKSEIEEAVKTAQSEMTVVLKILEERTS